MSDIHGCLEDFKEMLSIIEFDRDDHLYVLGDVFDRGDYPIEVLNCIRRNKNMTLIKGNHEKMFEEYYSSSCPISRYAWFKNGGRKTYDDIEESGVDKQDLYNYICNLPYVLVVDKFILTHAGLYYPKGYEDMDIDEFISQQEEDICLWDRSNVYNDKQYKDYLVICGHTPVQTILPDKDVAKIIKHQGQAYIDCGCVFKSYNGRLACLRLDDMKEFYV